MVSRGDTRMPFSSCAQARRVLASRARARARPRSRSVVGRPGRLETQACEKLDPPIPRRHSSRPEAEAARARERLAKERRGEVPHRRRRVDVVEDVLRGDRERQAAPPAATLVPSFRTSASGAVTPATPEASTGAAASPAAATAPAFTASLTARRPGLPPAPQGNRLAEAQVDDDEAGTIAEIPRDDGADGARVEQAIRGGRDPGRIGIGGERGPGG